MISFGIILVRKSPFFIHQTLFAIDMYVKAHDPIQEERVYFFLNEMHQNHLPWSCFTRDRQN